MRCCNMLEPEETGISSNLPKLEGKVAKVLSC
jgi:hypothetical protein